MYFSKNSWNFPKIFIEILDPNYTLYSQNWDLKTKWHAIVFKNEDVHVSFHMYMGKRINFETLFLTFYKTYNFKFFLLIAENS